MVCNGGEMRLRLALLCLLVGMTAWSGCGSDSGSDSGDPDSSVADDASTPGDDASTPGDDAGDPMEMDAGDPTEMDAGDPMEMDAGDPVDMDAGGDAGMGVTKAPRLVGYVYSAQPLSDNPQTPASAFSYNAAGGAMTIQRTLSGNYDVTFGGANLDGAVAVVTKYGTGLGHCNTDTPSGDTIHVRCYNGNAANLDTKFVLSVFHPEAETGRKLLAFAHANNKLNATSTPQASRSKNDIGGMAITQSRTGTGQYQIEFNGLSTGDIDHAQVTTYHDGTSDDTSCGVVSWSGINVKVNCYGPDGLAKDSQFLIYVAGSTEGTIEPVGLAGARTKASTLNTGYTPNPVANAAGAVTVTRTDVGLYSVTFEGVSLNSGSHVQVSSSLGSGHACAVEAWAGTTVNVRCYAFNDAGDPNEENSAFDMVVLQ